MKRGIDLDFSDKDKVKKLYEKRYSDGYMESWSSEKKQKIADIILSLCLPDSGTAFDYGCGNGVLTSVLKEILPGWRVCGVDLSDEAVRNARMLSPQCEFFTQAELVTSNLTCDLLFSHHVLEHVYSVEDSFAEIDTMMKKESWMVHVLPCGNPGSFEHGLCAMRKNGIEVDFSNRFFFEEEGHLRRLTSVELINIASNISFDCVSKYFSNHYAEAIERITYSHPSLSFLLTQPTKAVSFSSAIQLLGWRFFLVPLMLVRLPIQIVDKLLNRSRMPVGMKAVLCIAYPYYLCFRSLDLWFRKKCSNEWRRRQFDERGSEMFLLFYRNNN